MLIEPRPFKPPSRLSQQINVVVVGTMVSDRSRFVPFQSVFSVLNQGCLALVISGIRVLR